MKLKGRCGVCNSGQWCGRKCQTAIAEGIVTVTGPAPAAAPVRKGRRRPVRNTVAQQKDTPRPPAPVAQPVAPADNEPGWLGRRLQEIEDRLSAIEAKVGKPKVPGSRAGYYRDYRRRQKETDNARGD